MVGYIKYSEAFKTDTKENFVHPAKSVRIALGALLIKK
jgi:hypothetical protein